MSTDLRSQIHTYGAQLEDRQAPITDVDIAELLGKVRQLPPTPRPVGLKPRLWVAAATGMAVLVLFGGLSLFLTRSDLAAPLGTTPPPATSVTTPSTTGPVAAEEAVTAPSGNAFQALPNESSIGWEWHETGFEYLDLVFHLRSGTYVAYNPGFDGSSVQGDGSVLYSMTGRPGAFDDPSERMLISTDGHSWSEVPLDRFDGFVSGIPIGIAGGAPYLYVSVRPVAADRLLSASWSTWGTDDGEAWFEVLVDGEPAAPRFMDFAQIGQQVVAVTATSITSTRGILISSDGGRSFSSIDPAIESSSTPNVFVFNGIFRAQAWTEERVFGGSDVWMEDAVLWESDDGKNWSVIGVTSGLAPQPDGRALLRSPNLGIESLPNGYLLLNGVEPRRATLSNDHAAYILESHDGGLTWNPIDSFPVTEASDFDSLIVGAYSGTTLDGWVVISTADVTLATDGSTWIRVDAPPTSDGGLLSLRGAVVSVPDFGWIALPSR